MSNIPDVNDGRWHRHDGGPMPVRVHARSTVDIMDMGEDISIRDVGYTSHAENAAWEDVCAYRVTTAHVEPPKPREWWISPEYSVVLTSHPEIVGSIEYIHVREVL
jgi:hypothetical protein